jgi:hypothetical protein
MRAFARAGRGRRHRGGNRGEMRDDKLTLRAPNR